MDASSSPEGRRPRILYFIVQYPNFSETYMHEEIRSVLTDYDVRIITYRACDRPRRDAFPYDLIPYEDPCLVYAQIEKVNQAFNTLPQRQFLDRVCAIVEEFKPDVMHGHYLGLGLLLRTLAAKYGIPFTIRTHSMDVLSEPRQKLEALCGAANSPWCLRVLAFPASRDRLIASGLEAGKVESCWPVLNFGRFYKPDRRPPTGRVLCAGPAIQKKAHEDFVELAAAMRGKGCEFDLYAEGPALRFTRACNHMAGQPVRITYADPDDMPDVYPRYDWLVYPSDPQINKVGLPVTLAEAQASGLGVCWQELPGRREEQLAYLDGAGFLFRSIHEVPDLLSRPYPEKMRLRGFEAARKCDIERHQGLLTEAWEKGAMRTTPAL